MTGGMGKNIEIYPMDHSPDSVGDDNEKATTVVADDWEETLKRIGGSQSDDWNHVLGNQALQSLWVEHSDKEMRQRQYNAAIAGLIGIAPQDEIEGMIAHWQVRPALHLCLRRWRRRPVTLPPGRA